MTTEIIERAADQLAPRLRAAFVEAVNKVRDRLDLAGLQAALDRDDLADALAIIGTLERDLERALDAFGFELSFGFMGAAALAGLSLRFRFDPAAPAADAARTSLVSEIINRIVSDSVRAIRSRISHAPAGATSETILEALGLTEAQARSLDSYRRALEAVLALQDRSRARAGFTGRSSPPALALPPALLRSLTAAQRNAVNAALKRGDLDGPAIDHMVDRHRAALVAARAHAIATTEATRVTNAAEHAAWTQAADEGALDRTAVRRFWRDVGDEKVRASHRAIAGMNPNGVALDEPFATPLGPAMFPPLEMNCRCRVTLAQVRP
jgi:hypothetical protein